VTCTRSGARAATAWPPRWTTSASNNNSNNNGFSTGSSPSSSMSMSSGGGSGGGGGGGRGGRGGPGPKLVHQYGQSPGTFGGAPDTPGRSVSPATDRSRSRSPSVGPPHKLRIQ
jgi:hypothetical protein